MSEVKTKDSWNSAVTKVEPNRISVRGYTIDQLMDSVSFSGSLYLILTGELPSKNASRMLDTILVSSVDHGVTPPSVLAALNCASTGGNLSQVMASAVLSINQFHGGAIENCQKALYDGVKMMKSENLTPEEAAEKIVKDAISSKKKLFGMGHRIHTKDPRKDKLFEVAKATGFYGDYCRILDAMAKTWAVEKGKELPVNVDGAIGAVLCEMGFDASLGNAFFMMARMPGILAHYIEEKARQKPMRRIDSRECEYDGPDDRDMPFDY